MSSFKKYSFIALLFILTLSGISQSQKDSLWNVWNNPEQSDTARLMAISKYLWKNYLFTAPDSAFYFSQLQYDFAENKDNKEWMADALYSQGISFYLRGEYNTALDYFNSCLLLREEIGN